ncbi:MAG TPA: hypothetical protein VN627_13765 [Novosphingobium sp.]|nr:hypothetical protein [Novosphingobium sp.]
MTQALEETDEGRGPGRPEIEDHAFLVGFLKSARQRGLTLSGAVREAKQMTQFGYERDPATGEHRLVAKRVLSAAGLRRRVHAALKEFTEAYDAAAPVLDGDAARYSSPRQPKPELLDFEPATRGRPRKLRPRN